MMKNSYKEETMKAKATGFGVIFCAVLMVLAATPAAAQDWTDVVQELANGKVYWSTGVIEATGMGAPPEKYYGMPRARPMALRAAKMDALRNLLEVTKGVRINSTTVVRDFVTESDEILARVEGMVRGAQIVKREYLSDGTVEVTMRMSLHGGFTQLVLPPEIVQVPQVKPVVPAPAPPTPPPTPPAAPVTPAPTPAKPAQLEPLPATQVFSGLVVNARGIAARPAMAPKILDEDGKEVYGSAYVSREFAVQQGMSGYAKDLTAAQQNPRVTSNPLTVKGIKTDGPGSSDIIISRADADLVRGASENLSFLKKCRVMIVLD